MNVKATSADEEVLVRSSRGRRVVPRTDAKLPTGSLPEHGQPTTPNTIGWCLDVGELVQEESVTMFCGVFESVE